MSKNKSFFSTQKIHFYYFSTLFNNAPYTYVILTQHPLKQLNNLNYIHTQNYKSQRNSQPRTTATTQSKP